MIRLPVKRTAFHLFRVYIPREILRLFDPLRQLLSTILHKGGEVQPIVAGEEIA